LAVGLILVGLAIDRARGGLGIDGAMLAGAIGFPCVGAAFGVVLLIFGGFRHLSLAEFAVMVFFLGVVGWGMGVIVGCWTVMIIRALDRVIRPRSSNDGPLGHVTGRGLVDRRLRHLRAGGHHQ
jgi:hypothetical protein